ERGYSSEKNNRPGGTHAAGPVLGRQLWGETRLGVRHEALGALGQFLRADAGRELLRPLWQIRHRAAVRRAVNHPDGPPTNPLGDLGQFRPADAGRERLRHLWQVRHRAALRRAVNHLEGAAISRVGPGPDLVVFLVVVEAEAVQLAVRTLLHEGPRLREVGV